MTTSANIHRTDEDSDTTIHNEEIRLRHGTALFISLRGNNRHYTPSIDIGEIEVLMEGLLVNKKQRYPDVSDSYGSAKNKHKWDNWRLHLYAKFDKSAAELSTESDKIDYVKKRCKDAAFDIIKTRADNTYINPNPYVSADEMVAELND